MEYFKLGEDKLKILDVINVVKGEKGVELSSSQREKVRQSRAYVEAMVENGDVVYGVNTGFGPLCSTVISREHTAKLQDNLLRSHSVGVGNPIPKEIAKSMLVLKAHALSIGYSGIREETLDRIIFFIKNDIVPVVPEQGSVGASGDLAPLASLLAPGGPWSS